MLVIERPAPVVLVEDEGVLAIDVPSPAVETTGEVLGMPAAAGQPPPPVGTDVVEGPNLVGRRARHEDRLIEDVVGDEIADPGDLLLPAGHLPDLAPELLVLF